MHNIEKYFTAPFTFSQSSLQDYVDCPRRFQLRYLDKMQWPAVETAPVLENERRQIEGQLFHRMVQQYLIGLPADKLTGLASTDKLRRWWENFLTHGPTVAGYSLFTELTLSAPVGNHRLIAKYDLVAVKPGTQTLIFDWKTYHKRPKDNWMADRLQTKVYPALLIQAGKHLNSGKEFTPEQIEMVYWYADFPDEPVKFTYNQSQYTDDWKKLEQLVREITVKQSFPLTEDEKKCSFCVYRSYCERGDRAGEGEALDAEVSAEDINIEQIQEIEF
jgi:CRISPR/Cas system-associated exonuclease Cas4 (RecB family)